MQISVVVPAFDEALVLPQTLRQLRIAARAAEIELDVVVVDNASSDGTGNIARAHGARVIREPDRRGVGRARNAGAAAATGDVLVFVDADVAVPEVSLARIGREMADATCIGGAFDTEYRPRRRTMRLYLRLWRIVGLATRMAQGACQFCTREAFETLGGYDEHLWMGEDVDLWWRLRRLARRRGARAVYVRDVRVVPSCRRWDQWPLWRTLLLTNPATTALLARSRRAWASGWYDRPPR